MIICSECRAIVHTKMMVHYRTYHPTLWRWAVKLNVGMRRKKA